MTGFHTNERKYPMFRTIAATAALALSIPLGFATPAQAANTSNHCHKRADWSLVSTDSNSRVKVKLYRSADTINEDGDTVLNFCAEAFDRRHSQRRVIIGISQYTEDFARTTGRARGGNRVSLSWSTTRDPEPLLVRASVGNSEVFAGWVFPNG